MCKFTRVEEFWLFNAMTDPIFPSCLFVDGEFDKLAVRRGVFKVETIGDW